MYVGLRHFSVLSGYVCFNALYWQQLLMCFCVFAGVVEEEEAMTGRAEVAGAAMVVVEATVVEAEVEVTVVAEEEVTVVVVVVEDMMVVGEVASAVAMAVVAAVVTEVTVVDASLPAATDGDVMELNLVQTAWWAVIS